MSRKSFAEIADELCKLVTEKNAAYGDPAGQSSKILRVLFPNGVASAQYQDLLLMTRVIDKLFRISNRKDAFGESPWLDIAGYGILGTSIQQVDEHQFVKEPLNSADDSSDPDIVLEWLHVNGVDDPPRVEANPEHFLMPHLIVQMVTSYFCFPVVDVRMLYREIESGEGCIASFLVGYRDDLPACSQCAGTGRCLGADGEYDCPWCDARGLSVMDEAMRLAHIIYVQWATSIAMPGDITISHHGGE